MASKGMSTESPGSNLSGSVAVVTGASSGIGRSTAHELAARGVQLVLCARSKEQLDRVTGECSDLGAIAVSVPADVTRPEDLARVAETARERFGGIDLWVNNAAVALFSRFGEEPLDDYRRVIETDLFGYIHGARACIQIFRGQGRGTLINVASANVRIPSAYLSSYAIANAGIWSLAGCLRAELADVPGVRVCTVVAGATDTPLLSRAGNYTGHNLVPRLRVHSPVEVAKAVVRCAEKPRDYVPVSLGPRVVMVAAAVAPGLFERFSKIAVRRAVFGHLPAEPSSGNLFRPVHQPAHRPVQVRTGSVTRKAAIGAGTAGAALLAGSLARSRR